jgi:hypothetical protein
MNELKKPIEIDGARYLLRLTFDIDDFIGDGVFNLEVCNDKGGRELETPFASSRGLPREWWIEAREVFRSKRY